MIHIENNRCKAEGGSNQLLADLAGIIETLYRHGFEKRDIMYAVQLGMKSDDEIEAEMKKYIRLFDSLNNKN